MGRPRTQIYCRTCGVPTERRGHWDKGWNCVYCAVAASAEAQRQINARQGEYYERWIAGMAASVDRAREKLADLLASADQAGER